MAALLGALSGLVSGTSGSGPSRGVGKTVAGAVGSAVPTGALTDPFAPPSAPATLSPQQEAVDAAAAADRARRKAAGMQGYASTILTGGQGLTTDATTQRKTLLGG